MPAETVYQYPPELLNLLVQTIPRLCRSKQEVITFFTGAGVAGKHLADLRQIIAADKASITKFEIVRRVLERINAAGDVSLRARREVLKRVTEFEAFATCWPDDQLEAKGLVAEIHRVIGVKDSFTRMSTERDKEHQRHQRDHETKIAALQKKRDLREQIRKELFAQFAEQNAHKRGKVLEGILNRLFAVEEISIREAFALCGDEGEGIVEQIDGVIELDGHVYLVEMKWWNKPLGRSEVSPHLVKLFSRSEARGIFIASSGYTDPAVTTCKDALSMKLVVLCGLDEIVQILDTEASLRELLKEKIHAAVVDKNPHHRRAS